MKNAILPTADARPPMNMKRDHVIFVVAMAILAAGLTDGLHRGFGLPWLAAAPITATLWGALSYRIYLQSQKELAEAEE